MHSIETGLALALARSIICACIKQFPMPQSNFGRFGDALNQVLILTTNVERGAESFQSTERTVPFCENPAPAHDPNSKLGGTLSASRPFRYIFLSFIPKYHPASFAGLPANICVAAHATQWCPTTIARSEHQK